MAPKPNKLIPAPKSKLIVEPKIHIPLLELASTPDGAIVTIVADIQMVLTSFPFNPFLIKCKGKEHE